jgi:hypothetical protein
MRRRLLVSFLVGMVLLVSCLKGKSEARCVD